MDRHGLIKATNQFSTVCGASTINNQIIFVNGHVSHFNGRALRLAEDQNIQPVVLKAGNSGNNHPNHNYTNEKLKSQYNYAKTSWMLKYGTEKHYLIT